MRRRRWDAESQYWEVVSWFSLIQVPSFMDSFADYFRMVVPLLWLLSPDISGLVVTLLHIPGHLQG